MCRGCRRCAALPNRNPAATLASCDAPRGVSSLTSFPAVSYLTGRDPVADSAGDRVAPRQLGRTRTSSDAGRGLDLQGDLEPRQLIAHRHRARRAEREELCTCAKSCGASHDLHRPADTQRLDGPPLLTHDFEQADRPFGQRLTALDQTAAGACIEHAHRDVPEDDADPPEHRRVTHRATPTRATM